MFVWFGVTAVAVAAAAFVYAFVPGVKPWVDGVASRMSTSTVKPTIDMAEQEMSSGDKAGAAQIAAEVVAADPSDADIDDRAGNVALEAGDEKAAARDYQAGEASDARDAWNYVGLGELYARQGRFEDADTQLRAALTI